MSDEAHAFLHYNPDGSFTGIVSGSSKESVFRYASNLRTTYQEPILVSGEYSLVVKSAGLSAMRTAKSIGSV